MEAESTVRLPGDVCVKIIHLADPKTANFSLQKKQCDLWEFVWGTSLLTASFLASLQLPGCSMLEIGGGSGLCSLSAALHSSLDHVTMTDLVADAVNMCQRSAIANNISNMSFKTLDWNLKEEWNTFDIVVASDVLFYRGTVCPVAETFNAVLKQGGIGILTDPFRLNTDEFESKLSDLGFVTETFLFLPERLTQAQNLQEQAFIDVKKVKMLLFRKPIADTPSKLLDEMWAHIHDILPAFVQPEIE